MIALGVDLDAIGDGKQGLEYFSGVAAETAVSCVGFIARTDPNEQESVTLLEFASAER